MTELVFREDAYLRDLSARVTSITDEGGIVLDRTIFYPTGGGQPGDSGHLEWDNGRIEIATAIKGQGEDVILVPAEPSRLPAVGTTLRQFITWERRHRHMRVHTALHLLSVVIPLPVTGGQIGADKGRLDFLMPEPPENKDELEETLNKLIACDFMVSEEWITEDELDTKPDLVKTMSVKPPRGAGRIRLVRIGQGENTADLQPCGGTHVAWTSEIGRVQIGKIESKGKQNRRVNLILLD
ncbi:alanyl-tRNA editing protein [Marivivens sp. LCG002]|uniref:alanyl-tRNA editing protein n=1 Tax=Marivivens sp. LCG002 TaxID=3051171 RepID=UPI0025520FE1|nr:alanyl-tRNA editing protein [Marivivens sp. LCG002]WIV52213.1 alanyl-tRNA editing protein [Marivivens sp. LCG002]